MESSSAVESLLAIGHIALREVVLQYGPLTIPLGPVQLCTGAVAALNQLSASAACFCQRFKHSIAPVWLLAWAVAAPSRLKACCLSLRFLPALYALYGSRTALSLRNCCPEPALHRRRRIDGICPQLSCLLVLHLSSGGFSPNAESAGP